MILDLSNATEKYLKCDGFPLKDYNKPEITYVLLSQVWHCDIAVASRPLLSLLPVWSIRYRVLTGW